MRCMTQNLQSNFMKAFVGEKAYCNCRNIQTFRTLHSAGPSKNSNVVSVCGVCCKPTQDTWRFYIALCSECMIPFSSPWEDVCKNCIEVLDYEYKSWRWGAKQGSLTESGNLFFPVVQKQMLDK